MDEKDLERTAERGRVEVIRLGCSAAFSIPGTGDAGGERLVMALELKESQVRQKQMMGLEPGVSTGAVS